MFARRCTLRRILFASLACMCAFVCLCACGCTTTPSSETYTSPYDFNGLTQSDGRYTYSEQGRLCSKTGIDVSHNQGSINWSSVANDGIDFAIIRVGNRGTTEGGLYPDTMFEENFTKAKEAGLPVGVYFFSQAKNEQEAREEADFVLEHLQGRSLDYPVVFDEEVVGMKSRAAGLSESQMTANARAFCQRIQQAGYTPMIYGNAQDIALLDVEALGEYDFWFAEYGAARPSGRFDFIMWQYTNNAQVAGIDTRVDMNLYFTEECAARP